MDFCKIAEQRQSCRSYDKSKKVENEKIELIMQTALLAPSACNSQPYKIIVCKNDKAEAVARATQGMGMNKFSVDAPIILVLTEDDYNKTAAIGAKLKANDYRSIDIGILTAYITSAATELGLETCILGWFDNKKIQNICGTKNTVRLVITLGYSTDDYPLRRKNRKTADELISYI